MKQILLVAIALIAQVVSYGQSKSSVTPKVSTPTETQVNAAAGVWFKKNYVELSFKDPYSYKLMKIKSFPISEFEYEQDKLNDAISKVEKRDSFIYKYSTNNLEKAIKDSTEQFEKRITLYKTTYDWAVKDIQKNKQTISEITTRWKNEEVIVDSLKEVVQKLPPTSKKNILYYLVSLDCYANNSYGNPILGRYAFKFFYDTKKGYEVIDMRD